MRRDDFLSPAELSFYRVVAQAVGNRAAEGVVRPISVGRKTREHGVRGLLTSFALGRPLKGAALVSEWLIKQTAFLVTLVFLLVLDVLLDRLIQPYGAHTLTA